jgi:hypothetical protein
MLINAVREPVAPGVNVTSTLHVPPAATEVPHVLLCPKSPAFVPAIVMLVMVSGAVPLLVSIKL